MFLGDLHVREAGISRWQSQHIAFGEAEYIAPTQWAYHVGEANISHSAKPIISRPRSARPYFLTYVGLSSSQTPSVLARVKDLMPLVPSA